MFQETFHSPAFEPEAPAAEPACDASRRQFINQTGRGLLAVGVATALPVAIAEAQKAGAKAGKASPPGGSLTIKLPSLSAATDPKAGASRKWRTW